MSSEPSGSIAFDTGALLEIVSGSESGAYAKRLLESGAVKGYANEMNFGELRYIICRESKSEQKSEEAVTLLKESGYFTISKVEEFMNQAAGIKCVRALAFPDCFAISIGESLKIPVLFATRETELVKEMKRNDFRTNLFFLDELADSKS